MRTTLIRDLLTPLILLAFATYLTVNLFLIEVTDSTDFPGPRFFPAIIAGLIYALTALELLPPAHTPAWIRNAEDDKRMLTLIF